MIRTLWSNEQRNAGTYSLADVWDGKDDNGNYVADKNYIIKVVSSNATYEWLRPIGNTSEEVTGETVHTHFGSMTHMVQVGTDMYFSVGYNESSTLHHKFAIGRPNRVTTTLKGGGQFIRYLASDGNIVYSGGQRDGSTTFITGIVPNPGGVDYLASFSAGTPYRMPSGSPFTYSAFDISGDNNFITGLAVQKTGSYLFATHNSVNELRVYNKISGAFVRTNSIYGCRDIASQTDNLLWVAHYSQHTGSTIPIKLTAVPISVNPATDNSFAFDGLPTVFKTYGGPQNSVGLRFNSMAIVTKVRIKPEAGSSINAVVVGDAGSENTFLATVNLTNSNGSFVDYTVSNRNPFDRVRLLNTNDSQLKVEELEIYGYTYSGSPIITKHTVNSDGTLSAALTTITGVTKALAIAVSPDGNKVAVADKGLYHQVKFYNTNTGALVSTLGRAETYSNPTVYDDKFDWYGTQLDDYGGGSVYLTYQTDGSLWVRDFGNKRCQHFAANNVYIDNIQLMGFSYSTQADINNPTRVFNDFLEFAVDYSTNTGRFVRNWARNITIPTVFDPDRMRSVATLSNGRTYCLYNKGGGAKEVLELDLATGLRHTGVYLDDFNCDLNPDGSQWRIGTNQVGQPTFWSRRPLTGFDANNNPVWGAAVTLETTPNVTPTDPVTRDGYLKRLQQSSGGVIASFSSDKGGGYHLGGVKNGQWVFKTSPSTTVGYEGDFPKDGTFDIANGVNNPGSFMQVVDRHIFWGYNGEFWKGSQTNMYNHYLDNGLMVGQFGVWKGFLTRPDYPAAALGDAGNALSGTYVKVGNDVHFFHCDEKQHGAIHHWKIGNLASINEYSVPITKMGTPTLPPLPYLNLMSSLPMSGSVVSSSIGRWSFAPAPNNNTGGQWEVRAGQSTYKKDDRNLRFSSFPSATGQTRDATCDLSVTAGVTNSLTTWQITGQLMYPEVSENDGNFLEVVDNTGKVIVRISRPETYPTGAVKANGTTIVSGVLDQLMRSLFLTSQPVSIRRLNNSLLVSYANYPEVTVSALDPAANLSAPTTLRVRLYSENTRGHRIDLANLKLYTQPTVVTANGTGLAGEYFNNLALTPPAAVVRTDPTIAFNWMSGSPIPGTINVDNFTVRWSGQVQAPVSGTYLFCTAFFCTSCDNGVRLWINGALVIDNWAYHSATDYTTSIPLTAGQKYDIKLEYRAGANEANVYLGWQYPGQDWQFTPKQYLYPAAITPPTQPTVVTANGTGLAGEYFNNLALTPPAAVVRTDPTIAFNWMSGSPIPGTINVDNFTVRWSGQVQAPVSGTYLFCTAFFCTSCDNGVRLWINGALVIDNWAYHSATDYTTSIPLTAGQKYDIKLEYRAGANEANVYLGWQYPGQDWQFTPKQYLYPAAITPPTQPTVVTANGTGLAGEYFNNLALTPPAAVVRTDPTIAFNWMSGSPIPGTINVDNFTVRWSGQVQAPVSGTYLFCTAFFCTSCDNGVRLWINGALVIDNWAYHSATDYTTSIPLTAGQKYDIKLEYRAGANEANVYLGWQYPGQDWQFTPKQYLYPATINAAGSRIGNIMSKITSSENADLLNNTEVYPVPSHDILWIQYYTKEEGDLAVKLISVTGQPVLVSTQRVKQGENTLKISVKTFKPGVYILNLMQDYRQVTKRVVLSGQ